MNSKVSVLLPVYNGEAYLREAIESVLAQDYPHFEFVIVENASTDATLAIITEYLNDQRIRLIRNEKTLPRLKNFVAAFDAAGSESRWLKFIGDDDRFLPGCLTKMVQAAEKGERTGLVSSHYYDGGRLETGALPVNREHLYGAELLRMLLLKPRWRSLVFSPASLMVSAEAYRRCGGFRTDLLHADSELFYRILNHYNFAFVHEPLTVTGYHGESGQAGSTAGGFTFAEAYLIRYHNLKHYSNAEFSFWEKERIKFNLVNDSLGFMLGRIARGELKTAFGHMRKIPVTALYHLPLSFGYFVVLAFKKLLRGEQFTLFRGGRK